MRPRRRHALYASVVLLCSALSATALADAEHPSARLGVDVQLGRFAHGLSGRFFRSYELGPSPVHAFGLGDPVGAGEALAVSAGVQLDSAWALSMRIGFGLHQIEIAGIDSVEEAAAGSLSLQPSIEYMARDGALAPFVGLHAGARVVVSPAGTSAGFVAGISGGLHVFLVDDVSIAPAAQANVFVGDVSPWPALDVHVDVRALLALVAWVR